MMSSDKSNRPLVSIITPVFNTEKFVAQTIESVLAQTYLNWEMLIIDDCSTDASNSIINSYAEKDNRIKVYRMDKNSGVAICRTKAIELSQGDYLAFLDADDLWLPLKLEKQLTFMITNNCDFSFTEYEHINEDGKSLNKIARATKHLTYKKNLFHNFVGCVTVMYKQDVNNKIYPILVKIVDDYALFLEALKQAKNACGLSECLCQYRIRSGSQTSKKIKHIRAHVELMVKFHGKNWIEALFLLFTTVLIKYTWKYKYCITVK